ncbi:unnamed protein product [Phytophthora fragariaefolia]|uniref:Unnamed protein product n=1 Tax=Phytophthora fragariaefolia TaxID=1490495 RepID=A0A9W7D4F7_9STRA|nr:unnamed protein product [Phytophthora fragariaefolia]
MKNLQMGTSLADADSRMSKLRSDMHSILDKRNVEAVMLEKEQKKLVNYMVAALRPEDLREAVRTRLGYEENKKLRSDVISLYGWMLELLRSFMLWKPEVVAVISKVLKARNPLPRNQSSSNSTPHKPPEGFATGGQPGPRRALPRNGQRCLKCNSAQHLVKQCPSVGPREAARLTTERYSKFEQSNSVQREKSSIMGWTG